MVVYIFLDVHHFILKVINSQCKLSQLISFLILLQSLLIDLYFFIHLNQIIRQLLLEIMLHIFDVEKLLVSSAELFEGIPVDDLSFNFLDDVFCLLNILCDYVDLHLNIFHELFILVLLALFYHVIDAGDLIEVGFHVLSKVRHLVFESPDQFILFFA